MLTKGFILSLYVVIIQAFSSFHLTSYRSVVASCRSKSIICAAKKVRRKRKTDDESSNDKSSSSSSFDDNSGSYNFQENMDLPDFEVARKDSGVNSEVESRPGLSSDKPRSIRSSQMGSPKPLSSVSDLLKDRSLEAAFQFDEPVEADPLPSLSDFTKAANTKDVATVGKESKAERKKKALSKKAEEEKDGVNFFSFLGSKSDEGDGEVEDINFVKVRRMQRRHDMNFVFVSLFISL
jgi:hypothetical protein